MVTSVSAQGSSLDDVATPKEGELRWINLQLQDEAQVAVLEQKFGFHPRAVGDDLRALPPRRAPRSDRQHRFRVGPGEGRGVSRAPRRRLALLPRLRRDRGLALVAPRRYRRAARGARGLDPRAPRTGKTCRRSSSSSTRSRSCERPRLRSAMSSRCTRSAAAMRASASAPRRTSATSTITSCASTSPSTPRATCSAHRSSRTCRWSRSAPTTS